MVKKVLLLIDAVIISILGVFFIPCNLIYNYGDDVGVVLAEYVPIWKLIDNTRLINDNFPRYELIWSRIIYMFLLIVLISTLLYFLLEKKHSKTDNDEHI